MGGVISVTAISWHIFICLFLAGTLWVGDLWALICRALEGGERVTAGSPGRGEQRREDLAVSGTKHGCCGKGPCCRGSARCHGNKDGSLIGMRADVNPPSAVLLASPPAAPVPACLSLSCAKCVGGELVWRDPVRLRVQNGPRREG